MSWHTPPQIARMLRVAPETIIGHIRAGRLAAVNLSAGPLRPRYRVSPEALADFLRGRETRPPAPRPARKTKISTKDYFPDL